MGLGLVRIFAVSVGDSARGHMVSVQAASRAVVRSEKTIGDAEVSLVA